MASNVMKTPLIRHIAVRGYAAACPSPATRNAPKIEVGKSSNGIVVTSVDNGSPVARVAIAFKAGARYEPVSEPGLTHVLRSAAGLTTATGNTFIMTRSLQQLGASVSATVDRENIIYTLEVTQDNLSKAVALLNSVVSGQEFRPWELSDNAARLKYDIAALPPQVRAVDLLHKAAYRRGLGNSLFISPRRIGHVSSESLQHFVNNNFTADRCAVTIVGGGQARGMTVAQNLVLGSGSSQNVPSRYAGGELRKEMGGELAHVALAVEGAKAGTPEAVAFAVLAKALGSGPSVKWGADNSVLASAIGNVGPFAAAGFNLAYSDSGLFGAIISVPKDEAMTAVNGVARALKRGNISADAIRAGKNLLKLQLLSEQQCGGLAESLSAHALGAGVRSPQQLADDVDALTDKDIAAVLSKVTESKLSLGAAGNLSSVPYVDEITGL